MQKKSKSQKAPHLKLSFPLGKEKIAAIQRCLAKGQLTITISQVELLKGGRAKNGYAYD
jgi:hypothetical protein